MRVWRKNNGMESMCFGMCAKPPEPSHPRPKTGA